MASGVVSGFTDVPNAGALMPARILSTAAVTAAPAMLPRAPAVTLEYHAAGFCPVRLATTRSVIGVMLTVPRLTASEWKAVPDGRLPPETLTLQGSLTPLSEAVHEPEAPVMTGAGSGPAAHLTSTVPPAMAAPVAAVPVRVPLTTLGASGCASLPPPQAARAADRKMTPIHLDRRRAALQAAARRARAWIVFMVWDLPEQGGCKEEGMFSGLRGEGVRQACAAAVSGPPGSAPGWLSCRPAGRVRCNERGRLRTGAVLRR